jgi:serine/threonine protein kinase
MHVGDPIERWLASSTLSREQQVRELFKWGSISLSAAHAGGIVHRDVRLSNFLWVCGAIQLIDFNFSAPVGTPVVLSDGAIFDCRPVGMADRSVGDSVEWREADDMSMLASMCLDFTCTT